MLRSILVLCLFVASLASFASEKLCFLADVGTGKTGQFQVARALEKEGCRRVFMMGDLIYSFGLRGVNDKQLFTKFYNPYKVLIETQKVDFYLVAGNHDWAFFANPSVWTTLAKSNPWLHYQHFYYTEILDSNVCLIALDTEKYFTNQINWFVKQKPNIKGCTFSIAMGHKPYFSPGAHGDATGDVKRLLENTVIGTADLYVSGHDHHLSDEGEKDHTHLLISGAGGKTKSMVKKPRNWGTASLGYFTLEIKDGVGTYIFKKVTGDKVEVVYQDIILGQGIR